MSSRGFFQKTNEWIHFLLVCNVFSFVFWKNPWPEKKRFEIIWPLTLIKLHNNIDPTNRTIITGNVNSSRVITRVINLIWEKGDFSGKKPMISAVRLGLSLQHCNLASLGLWHFINCGSKTGQRDFFLNWMNGRLYIIVICTGCWVFKGGVQN